MERDLSYTIFETDAGWMAVVGSPRGLLQVTLPRPSVEETLLEIGDSATQAEQDDARFQDLVDRFRSYFSGDRRAFPDRLDPASGTTFQRAVWDMARRIPYGETRSYGWIAEQIGKPGAARAVGQAIGRNPLGIVIPCHRVVAADGTLGGFGGGLDLKQRLLGLEAAGTRAA